MTLQYFTLVHILISLVGIATGFGALSGWLSGRLLPGWTALFLVSTIATSVTGFFFPFRGFTPAIGVGILSLLILGLACYSLYIRKLGGVWRKSFLISSVIALYLNVFVLIVQMFQKFPALVEIAPNQSGPAFAGTHVLVLAAFIVLGIASVRRYRGDLSIA